MHVLAAVFAFVVLLFAHRLTDLQLSPDPALAEGLGSRVRIDELPAPRGEIVDRFGRSFALSLPAPTVVADARLVPDGEVPRVVAELSALLSTDPAVLTQRLRSDRAFVYLERQVDLDVGEAVSALDLPGVYLIEEPRRHHPNGACSGIAMVGRVDIDHNGISGLEEGHNDRLTGVPGQIVRESSADGRLTIPGGEQLVEAAQPGETLELTLDRNVQYQAEQILVDAVARAEAGLGVVLIMIPNTGEIVAAANVIRDNETGEVTCTTTNIATIWTYEPGSIVKPLTMAAVIEADLVGPHDAVTVPAEIVKDIEDGEVKRFRDWWSHDEVAMTPTQIISESSNLGTIVLAERLGPDGLYTELLDFGLGSRTALEFKGEASGILDPLDSHVLELPNVSIGQSVAVTPLQMLQAYNTLANGGVHVDPVVDASQIGQSDPRRVVDQSTARAVVAMMDEVVESGTGARADVVGFDIAGKTGTAWQPCGGGIGYLCEDGESRHYTASFVGVVSNDMGPALSVIVIIDDPQGEKVGGGSVAAPVFAEIVEYAVRQLRVPPTSAGESLGRVRAEPATVAAVEPELGEEPQQ